MILFNAIKCSRKILSGYIPQTATRYFQHPIFFNKIEIKHQKFHRKIIWISGNEILYETILLYYHLSALISQLHAQSSSSSCLIFHRILLSPAESRTGSHRILSSIDQDSIRSCLGSCGICPDLITSPQDVVQDPVGSSPELIRSPQDLVWDPVGFCPELVRNPQDVVQDPVGSCPELIRSPQDLVQN